MSAVTDLSSLSNAEINIRVLALRSTERDVQVDLLLFLGELEHRSLHLEKGYSSLFSYLTKALGYSEASASRRVRVARLFRHCAQAVEGLRDGRFTLITLSLVSSLINEESKDEILESIAHKSQAEVEDFVALRKEASARPIESIKPVRPVGKLAPAATLFSKPSKSFCNHTDCAVDSSEPVKVASVVSAPVEELKYEIRFQVSGETKRKLHRVQALLSGTHPRGMSLEATLDLLLDEYLERNSREAKLERAKQRIEKQKKREELKSMEKESTNLSIGCEEGRSATRLPQQPVGKFSSGRRPIPAETKRKVFERDNYCCSYRSPEGVACESVWDLEVDHVHPVAFGGRNELENLRVLCRGHNMLRVRQMQESALKSAGLGSGCNLISCNPNSRNFRTD